MCQIALCVCAQAGKKKKKLSDHVTLQIKVLLTLFFGEGKLRYSRTRVFANSATVKIALITKTTWYTFFSLINSKKKKLCYRQPTFANIGVQLY